MGNNNKTIIITGVTSYLGRNLAKYLISKGYVVLGLVRKNSKNIKYIEDIDKLKIYYYDISEIINDNIKPNLINEILKNNKNIYIYHLAWDSKSILGRNDEELQESNYENSKNILNMAKLLNAKRLIFASSQADNGSTPYGKYKKAFADYGKSNFAHFVIARIFSVYGGDDEKKTLITYIKDCEKNHIDIKLGKCEHLWNYLYINDFSYIMEKLLNDNLDENLIYDIASDDTRKLKDYIMNAGIKSKIIFDTNSGNNDIFYIPDITNTKKILDNNFAFTKFDINI